MIRPKLLLVVLVALSWGAVARAQSLGGDRTRGLKENLDLPYDAAGSSSDEEAAPEVIVLYGSQFEGDGFFFTVDQSGSMLDRGELDRAKLEISRNVREFSPSTEFAVNFFDSNVKRFPVSGRPAEASTAMKDAAVAWISSQAGGDGSCCQKGLMAALTCANQSTKRRKVIVYVGDGGGTCGPGDEGQYLNRALGLVTSQNFQRVQINTIGVLMDASRTMHANFLRALASANGGTYRQI